MATHSLHLKTGTPSSGSAFATFHAGANRAYVQQILITVATGVASEPVVVRPNNTPVGSTIVAGVPFAANGPATTSYGATAWTTAPTIGSNDPIDGAAMAGTVGTGFQFVYDYGDGIEVPPNGALAIWQAGASTGPAIRITIRYREG